MDEENAMHAMKNLFQKQSTSFDDYLNDEQQEQKEDNGFAQAYRLSGLAKIDGICDFIETLAENGAKFLIFAHHMAVIDSIEAFVKRKRIGSIKIDGRVPLETRHDRVKEF